MPEQIVCANCGIRFSTDLAECPWCGTAPRAVAAAAPPPETTPSADADGTPASAPPPDPLAPAPSDPTPAAPAAPQPPPSTPSPAAQIAPAPAEAGGAAGASPTGLPQSDEPVVVVAAPPPAAPPAPPPLAAPLPPAEAAPPPAAPPAGTAPHAAPSGRAPRRRGRGARFLGYAIAILVLLIIGALLAEFAPLGPRQRSLTDTVTPVDPLGTDQTLVIETTEPPPTTEEPPETTEGTAATTTTVAPTTTAVPALEAIGEPIPLTDLRMGVDGLRDALLIGDDGTTVVGRLVATFGQPDADTGIVVSDGDFGTCTGDTVRVVRFGSLAVINTVDGAGAETFAAYRVDLGYQEGPSPADELLTISRLKAGDTVADLQAIYSGLEVLLAEGPDGASFELRNGAGELLLHGPTTGVDRASEIRGIYSPNACA